MQELSIEQARRIALAAQGFDKARPVTKITARHLRDVVERLGVVQIDSVNVLARSHYLPFFSRLGHYDRDLLHHAAQKHPRQIFEYWAHEASYVPVATYPLMRWRMANWQRDAWRGVRQLNEKNPALIQRVLIAVKEHGPVTATDVENILAHDTPRTKTNWGWNWSDAKTALEVLFWSGEISAAARNSQFQRLYDVTEKIIPQDIYRGESLETHEAIIELTAIAARALGIASIDCLKQYFRLTTNETQSAVTELTERDILQPVRVRGWEKVLFRHRDSKIPRQIKARALLSPFDSLLFNRQRLEHLFDFRYRIEIYTPQPKRQFGYYVLPFLLGDQLVARVDLKANYANNSLEVRAAHREENAPENTAEELYEELQLMARWLGLSNVDIMKKGNLAGDLLRG
jgi:uncharacterized protein YcaQ